MYRITIALAIVGVCLMGGARPDGDAAGSSGDLKQVCQDGLTQASRGDAKGLSLLWQHTTTSLTSGDEQNTQAHNQIEQLAAFQEQYGTFLGCELAEEKKVTNTLCRYVYLAKYERNVICWSFTLYRPQDEWKILYFNWTDNAAAIDSLFQGVPVQIKVNAPESRPAPIPQSVTPNP